MFLSLFGKTAIFQRQEKARLKEEKTKQSKKDDERAKDQNKRTC